VAGHRLKLADFGAVRRTVLAAFWINTIVCGNPGWPGGEFARELREKDSSFSEEKEAKRLLFLRSRQDPGHGLDHGTRGEIKVFWFFSSEKNILLTLFLTILRSDRSRQAFRQDQQHSARPERARFRHTRSAS
jgi:hypothetical protein